MITQIYEKNILTTNVQLSPLEYNQDIDIILLEKLKEKVEGKCDNNGFIKKDSCKIINRGLGQIQQSQFNGSCVFTIKYSVDICTPVEGNIYKCLVKNKNKMGLFCELVGEDDSPLNIILAKQHHLEDEEFDKIPVNDIINVEIIGVKIEYRETYISCIGKLIGKETENIENSYFDKENQSMGDDIDEETFDEETFDEEEFNNDPSDEDQTEDNNLEEKQVNVGHMENKNIANLMDINIKEKDVNVENINMEEIEGVQNMESVMNLGGESELEELGDNFEGEVLDLNEISNKNLIPVYNEEEFEYYDKEVNKDVYNLVCKTSNQYKTFSKPRKTVKNYMNYFIYLQLNNLFLDFYDKNGIEVKKIMIGKNNKYKKEMKIFLEKMAKSLVVEEVDDITHVL